MLVAAAPTPALPDRVPSPSQSAMGYSRYAAKPARSNLHIDRAGRMIARGVPSGPKTPCRRIP